MTAQDWIMGISVVFVFAGWFINGHINRTHEIAKKRMEYRLKALESFLPVFFSIQAQGDNFFKNDKSLSELGYARRQFQLYGKTNEVDLFEAMIKGIESRNVELVREKLQELILLVRTQIRNELGLH